KKIAEASANLDLLWLQHAYLKRGWLFSMYICEFLICAIKLSGTEKCRTALPLVGVSKEEHPLKLLP
ncbi:11712_t:CDS:1, partial [Acaulospora colombiana]